MKETKRFILDGFYENELDITVIIDKDTGKEYMVICNNPSHIVVVPLG